MKSIIKHINTVPPVLILVLSFVLYGNTLNHDYTQDDAIVIYDNMFTQEGISGIPGLLKYDTFYGFFKTEGKSKLVSGGRYRPLSPILFAIEVEFFGKNPLFGHLFNILWYALLNIVLFYTLMRILQPHFSIEKSLLISGISTLLYLSHPIHTEVVANIKGRDEILALLGSMGSLLMILKYEKAKLWQSVVIASTFLLACLAKENAITFIAIAPISLILFRGYTILESIRRVSPLLVGASIFLAIRFAVLGADFGGTPMELMNNPFIKMVNGSYTPFGFDEKMATILHTIAEYWRLLIWPNPLTHDYYPRHIDIMHFSDIGPWIGLAILLLLTILSIVSWKKNKLVAFASIFFLASFSIVSNFLFPVGTNMSERFMFMPSIGFVLLAAWSIEKLSTFNRLMSIVCLTFVLIGFVFLTTSRNQVWKNDYTLFTTDVLTSTNSAKVLNAAGGAITTEAFKQSAGEARNNDLDKAIQYLDKATKIHPTYKNAYLIKGNAYYLQNKLIEAAQSYEQALKIDSNYGEAVKNLAVVLRDLGKDAGEKQGNLTKAIEYLTRSIQLVDSDAETYRLLGVAHGIQGNHSKAIEYFTKMSELSPNNAYAFLNLALAYEAAGDINQATIFRQKALSIDPNILSEK